MEEIFEDDFLKITARQRQQDPGPGKVLLSFTGVGHAMGGIDVQKPEFFGSGQSFDNILFLTDKTRSWGTALDFEAIAATIAPFTAGKDLYAIGNSMGGFLSIVASAYLPILKTIAFAPQYSVDPAEVPWETRWKEYTDQITTFSPRNAAEMMTDRTTYYIFSGGLGLDRLHSEMFPVRPNVHHYVFPEERHDVAILLKGKDILSRTIQACFLGREGLKFGLPFYQISPATA